MILSHKKRHIEIAKENTYKTNTTYSKVLGLELKKDLHKPFRRNTKVYIDLISFRHVLRIQQGLGVALM